MQKNKIVSILILGMMLSPIFVIQAVEVPTVKNIHPEDKAKLEALTAKLKQETAVFKNNIETSKTEIGQKIEATKDAAKTKLAVKSQEKVKSILDDIYNKLNEKVMKLSQVSLRIEAKIKESEAKGVDVTQAKNQFQIAKDALSKASANLFATKSTAEGQVLIETSKETLRSMVKMSEDSIKSAAAEYRKILPLITSKVDTGATTTSSAK